MENNNRPKRHVKTSYSMQQQLRLANGERFRPTIFNDAMPNWIRNLCEELGIPTPIKRANPIDRMQRDLQRKHNGIEKSCRLHTERRQKEKRLAEKAERDARRKRHERIKRHKNSAVNT